MKAATRYISTAVLVLVAGLWVFSGETIAEELGYAEALRQFIRGGVTAMVDWGYADWVWNLLVLFAGATVALWIEHFVRKATTVTIPKEGRISEEFSGKHFRNCEVKLDGKKFEDCEFHNVTFVYNGGAISMDRIVVEGCLVRTDIKEMERFTKLMHKLGMIAVPVYDAKGNKHVFQGRHPPQTANK